MNGYFIAEGMQFDVYNINLTKVLKKPKDYEEIFKKLAKRNPSQSNVILNSTAKYYIDTRRLCTNFLTKKIINDKFAVTSISKDTIKQERITPIVQMLRSCKQAKHKVEDICNEIVEMNFEFWNLGIFEISFGIEKYGINNQGRVILYDPFEMSTDVNDLKYLILNKWWIQCNRGLPIELQVVVNNIFSKCFNIKNIYNLFKKNDLNLYASPNLIKPIKSFIKTGKNKNQI